MTILRVTADVSVMLNPNADMEDVADELKASVAASLSEVGLVKHIKAQVVLGGETEKGSDVPGQADSTESESDLVPDLLAQALALGGSA